MRKVSSYFILILAAALISGCSGLNKMKKNASLVKYEVTPKVLETHGGIIDVTIKGTYPSKYFDNKTILEVTPVLTYTGGETAFDKAQLVQGEKVQANNKVISNIGGDFTYTAKVPYKDAMKISELVVRIKATRGKTVLNFDPVKIADGVIATSTLTENHVRPMMLSNRFVRIIPENKSAELHYLINEANLQTKDLKSTEVQSFRDYVKMVSQDPSRQLKTTEISSFASPDGPMDLNEKLSAKRGVTADKFMKKELEKVDAAKATGFFNEKTTAEDWDGFKSEVEKSNLQDKDLIIRVLSMYSDPVVREKEIKNMSSAFEALKKDILPKLRRSKLFVNVDLIGRSDEQILSQMKSDPKVLSVEEMLYAATLTKDISEQLKFYQAAAENFPKDIRGHVNVSCANLLLGKADDAIAALEKAKAIENNDVVKNNLGFSYLLKGDDVKANDFFTSMATATPESKFGLGILATKKGEYDKAVNYFGSEPSYDLALALLLKKDANKAKVILDGLKETEKNGKPSYIKAVVGARLEDRNYLLNNLREAVGLNPSWKAYAKTDLEFSKFINDDTFKAAVQ